MVNRLLTVPRFGVATIVALLGCAEPSPTIPGVSVDVIATGLDIPWAMAPARDGRLFISERTGRIRVVVNDTLRRKPWVRLAVVNESNAELGLMGIALHPDFPTQPYLYTCYSGRNAEGRWTNRVVRLTDSSEYGTSPSTMLDGIPAGRYHNGCRLAIGPGRKLYITTGDSYEKPLAQSAPSFAGKVLRLELDVNHRASKCRHTATRCDQRIMDGSTESDFCRTVNGRSTILP